MEKIFSFAWRGKRGIEAEENAADDHYVDDEQGLQRKHVVDTTLQIHFFGKKGNKDLEFDGFYKFMRNLQTEVLELEFHEFSKGHEKISEVDFAKILLRYTYLDTDEYDNYLDRLLDREAKEKGVSFEEFRQFCQFLNNLEDFSIAMRMYTLADRSISKGKWFMSKLCNIFLFLISVQMSLLELWRFVLDHHWTSISSTLFLRYLMRMEMVR